MRDWRGVGAWARNAPVVINRGHRQGQPGGGGGGADTLFRRAVRYAAGLPQGHLLALRQPLASGIHVIQNLALAGKLVFGAAVLAVGFRNRVLAYAVIWRLVSVGLMGVVAVMVMTLLAMTNSLVRPMLVLVRRTYAHYWLSGQRKRLQDSQPTCAVCALQRILSVIGLPFAIPECLISDFISNVLSHFIRDPLHAFAGASARGLEHCILCHAQEHVPVDTNHRPFPNEASHLGIEHALLSHQPILRLRHDRPYDSSSMQVSGRSPPPSTPLRQRPMTVTTTADRTKLATHH